MKINALITFFILPFGLLVSQNGKKKAILIRTQTNVKNNYNSGERKVECVPFGDKQVVSRRNISNFFLDEYITGKDYNY